MNAARRARVFLLIAAAAAAVPRPARAQERPVYSGDRVRITTGHSWTAFVQWVTADSIRVIEDGERDPRSLALGSIERVEVSMGPRSRGRPFLIGALTGAAIAGGTAGVISQQDGCADEPPDSFGFQAFCESVGPVAVVGSAVVGFAVGGAVGALFGGGDRWVPAAMPVRVGLAPTPGGAGARVTLFVPASF